MSRKQQTARKIRVRDLVEHVGAPYPRPCLICRVCGEESSANRGDYFMASPDHVFTHCGRPMMLAVRRTVYTEVAQ